MIQLTRIDGTALAVNADLVERVETDDVTVVTLVDGGRYLVLEPTEVVIERMVQYRASILVAADHLATSPATTPAHSPGTRLRLVSDAKES